MTYLKNEMASEAPITKASLSVLDLERVIDNPNFRNDMNVGHHLVWRRRDDGKQRSSQVEQYWEALISDLTLFSQELCQVSDHTAA